MKRRATALLLCMVFLLSACRSQAPAESEQTIPLQQTMPSEPVDALTALRADMKPPVIAVAVLGFPELWEEFGIMDFLMDEYPLWMEEHDFIRNMPEERIVYTARSEEDWGEWICIVPQDPEASVCVNVVRYSEDYSESEEEVAYRSEKGDPILLQADISEQTSVTVVVTDSEGRGVSWTPYWDNAVPIPEAGYSGALVMDFSPLSEKTPYEVYQTQGWRLPELSELTDTFWLSFDSYALELNEDSVPGDNGGWAAIYDVDEIGAYTRSYTGSWWYEQDQLHLSLIPESEDGCLVDESFPVLMLDGQLWIGRNDNGSALPHFQENQIMDVLEQPKG